MLSARSGMLSSKRVIGVLIFLIVLSVYTYCGFYGATMPEETGELLMSATALLGVDSVMRPFAKKEEL